MKYKIAGIESDLTARHPIPASFTDARLATGCFPETLSH
jgi:hypothetical protein